MTRRWLLLASLMILPGLVGPAMADDRAFEAGQAWTYEGAQLPSSRIIIGKVDDEGAAGQIVSVSVTNVPVADPVTKQARVQTISHLPMSAEALRASGLQFDQMSAIPDEFGEGYSTWRQAFDAKKGGYFTVPMKEVIQVLLEALASQQKTGQGG